MDKDTTHALIDRLLKVQEQDGHIARRQQELEDIPARKQAAQGSLNQKLAALEFARERIKARQLAVKQIEIEVGTHRDQVARLREQQFQIKSNLEFKTLSREIEGLQTRIKEIEDRELELMEHVEEARRAAERLQEELAREEARVAGEHQNLEARRQVLETELAQLRRDRDALTEGLDPAWLGRYVRVLENRGDVALVPAEHSACGGCHMTLMPHVLQDIKRADTIVTCTFCGRLLYWPR